MPTSTTRDPLVIELQFVSVEKVVTGSMSIEVDLPAPQSPKRRREPASPNASEALHYSAPTGCAWQSGERPPFNVNLPVFTPGRDKEHEEWNTGSWEILDSL
jgi:hypothetical protein